MAYAAFLASLHVFYTLARPRPVLAAMTGSLAATSWSLTMVGIVALAGLGAQAPLIDGALIRIDAAMGLDAGSATAWIARLPFAGGVLGWFYTTSIPLVFFTMLVLAMGGQRDRMWVFCVSISGAALACALLAGLVPAIGAFAALEFPRSTLDLLPEGAGTYHLAAFDAYRTGAVRTIDVARLEGVVTFPSFHVAMALATAHAYRGWERCAWLAYAWNGVVIVSTIPIGGHYFVDLVAGAVVWLLVLTAATAGVTSASGRERINLAVVKDAEKIGARGPG